ncbi:MAG: polysaccharide deacetylase family protein [Tabrizicola sp.]|nr:polysaccharide deacetylase family protein [Tabrizicola sp.]
MAKRIGIIFHGIGTPDRPLEPGEAPYWISTDQYRGVLDQICALPDPDAVCISFDDGNRSDIEIGLPHLQERNLRADFFVLSGRIGKPGSLDATAITALRDAGMGIGSHGVDHVAWNKLAPDALKRELELSRDVLENICNARITAAGIPFGDYSAPVLSALQRAGYDCAYSSDGGRMDDAAFLRPRTSVQAAMTAASVGSILSARQSIARRMRRMVGMARKRLF